MSLILEVIGYKGVVGNATYQWLNSMKSDEVELLGRDIDDPLLTAAKLKGNHIMSYVCVPEKAVTAVVGELNYADLIIIRSTVPPGTCSKLMEETGKHICHMPEFLVAATAVVDEFNQDYLILGACCEEHTKALEGMYSPYMPLIVTDTYTSEILKLAKNSYLACLISFWNEIEQIARAAGTTGHRVGKLATLDNRVSKYGANYHHKYGGACLPKDIEQLAIYANGQGINTPLLNAIAEVNECQES